MFDIAEVGNELIKRKVRFLRPTPSGGEAQTEFTAWYELPEQDVIDKMINENWRNSELVAEVVRKVDGVRKNGQEITGEEQLELVLKYPPAVAAMAREFWRTVAGKDAELKNSGRRR